MHTVFLRIFLLSLLVLGSVSAAVAQSAGSLRGTIIDSVSARPVEGVGVSLQGQPGGTVTDVLGAFRFTGLAAGTYTVRATALGYQAQTTTVTVRPGETQTLRLALPAVALNLTEVTVSQPRDFNQSLAAITNIDKVLRPVNSAQDLLRLVPGLFIAQHAGGGKAEQIFIRGFDADHGTDFNVSV